MDAILPYPDLRPRWWVGEGTLLDDIRDSLDASEDMSDAEEVPFVNDFCRWPRKLLPRCLPAFGGVRDLCLCTAPVGW